MKWLEIIELRSGNSNLESQLGEDVARGFEILITKRMHDAVKGRSDCQFTYQIHEEIPFHFYEAVRNT